MLYRAFDKYVAVYISEINQRTMTMLHVGNTLQTITISQSLG